MLLNTDDNLQETLPKEENPFPGLRPFRHEESHLYFGREGQIEEVVQKLSEHRFVGIIGTSGIGKSSFTFCGLLPKLYNDPEQNWKVLISRPGIAPIRNLARSFYRTDSDKHLPEELREINENAAYLTLSGNSMGLIELVRSEYEERPANYLIFIDQFEELFRFRQNDEKSLDEAAGFIKLLTNAVDQADVPVYVLITMRSDFIGDCSVYPALTSKINDSQFLIPQMTRQEKRAAILGPISVMNGRIDEHFVQQILNDVGDNTDALPIMQHAMMRTWNYWQTNTDRIESISLAHYEAIGGMKNALSVHANEAFNDLNDRQKEICESIFKTITEKGKDGRSVRRPTRLGTIAQIAGAPLQEVIEVIDYFRSPGRTLLMPPYSVVLDENSVIDISHESLMRIWVMLSKWVEEEAESVKLYLRLSEASELHQLGKAGLWRPPDLQLALAWQEEQKPSKEWGMRYHPAYERTMLFLEFSKKEYEKEQLNKEKMQRRKIMFMRIFTLICLLGIVVASLLVLYGEQQRQEAENQRQEANRQSKEAEKQAMLAREESEKAKQSEKNALEQQRIAEEQAEKAMRSERRANEQKLLAETATHHALQQQQLALKAEKEAQNQRKNAFSMRMLSIAKSMAIKSVTLNDATQKGLVAQQAYLFNKKYNGKEHDPDIYDAMYNAVKKLKDESFNSFREHTQNVRALVSTYRGSHIFSAGSDGKIFRWNTRQTQNNFTLLHESPMLVHKALAISSDEKTLVSGGDYGYLQLFDLSNPSAQPRILKGKVEQTWFLGFTYDNKGIISGGTEKKIYYWDQKSSRELYSSDIKINTIAASPTKNIIVAGNAQGQIIRIDLDNNNEATVIYEDLQKIPVVSISYDKQGVLLAVGNEKGIVRIWDMEKNELRAALIGHTARINNIRFSNDSKRLATGSFDKTVRIWDIQHIQEARDGLFAYDPPIVLKDHDDWVWSISFSPDGEKLLAGCKDNLIRVWPTNINSMAHVVCEKISRNFTNKEWDQFVADDIDYQKTCENFSKGEGVK
jgi:WD40 repeat protein